MKISARGVLRALLLCLVLATLALGGCGDGGNGSGGGTNNTPIAPVIPSTTKVLDTDTMAVLVAVSADTTQLTFSASTTQLAGLATGDVIVVGLSALTPDGLLRKVDSVGPGSGSNIVVTTSDATLEDAIQDGELDMNLAASDLQIDKTELADGVTLIPPPTAKLSYAGATTSTSLVNLAFDKAIAPGITVSGSVAVTPALTFKMKFHWFSLRYVMAKASVTETAKVDVTAAAGISVAKDKEIAKYKFRPVVGSIGSLPVYIRPVLVLNVGANGSMQASLSTGVSQQTSYAVGLEYDNGTINPLTDKTSTFTYTAPSLDGSLTVHPYVKATLIFYLYGVVGPSGAAEGYMELNADVNTDPWWKLYGGLAGKFGIKAKIFSKTILDVERNLIDLRTLLAQGQKPALAVSPPQVQGNEGNEGGPFNPGSYSYTLSVVGDSPVNWSVSNPDTWVDISTTSGAASSSGVVDPTTPVTVVFEPTATANTLSPGLYRGDITFTNVTNGEGNTTRSVALTVDQPPSIRVEPGPDEFYLPAAYEGETTFSSASKTYTVYATGGDVSWTAQSDVDWLTLSPASGTTTDGNSTAVTAQVDQQKASKLAADSYLGTISFTNTTNGSGDTKRTAWLSALMKVAPQSAATVQGPEGGPFTLAQDTYTITAVNADIPWHAETEATWLTLSASDGTAPAGGTSTVTLAINDTEANKLSVGTHNASLTFTNTRNPNDTTTVPISLTVLERIAVSPSTGLTSIGAPGGPFTPASAVYTVNAPAGPITWTATADQAWLKVNPSSGNADPANPASVTVSIDTAMAPTNENTYQGNITFTSTSGNPKSVTRTAQLLVANIAGNWQVTCTAMSTQSIIDAAETAMGQSIPIDPSVVTITITGDNSLFTLSGLPPGSLSGSAPDGASFNATFYSNDMLAMTAYPYYEATALWWFEGQNPTINLSWYVKPDSTGSWAQWTCNGAKAL